MIEIRTNDFFVLGRTLYPASGRPLECGLEMVGAADVDLKPATLTVHMLLEGGFSFCAGKCGKCIIIIG